ncbi:MAG TPA: hypothetical protein VFD41_03865 [Actinomycetales bacterium]|nr:hypothetical protein [Actinomycetales bacterium]
MALTARGRRTRVIVVAVAAVAVVGTGAALLLAALGGTVVVTERCTATVEGGEHSLAPDQAANAATIAAISVQRGLPARAATIGIATAIQESKLRNIDYGDRDSVGLFQQRPSQGWGTVEEIMDPVYAINAFYDVLVEIEGYQALEITDAAQRVQRSAFPGAYGDHEPEGRAFASALTGYSTAALTCRLRTAGDLTVQEVAGNGVTPRAQAVLDAAQLAYGDLDAAPASDDGTTLAITTPDGDAGTRQGWSLTQWAVASADALDVVRVVVDSQQWQRGSSDEGWVAAESSPSGEVLIEVAAGT